MSMLDSCLWLQPLMQISMLSYHIEATKFVTVTITSTVHVIVSPTPQGKHNPFKYFKSYTVSVWCGDARIQIQPL